MEQKVADFIAAQGLLQPNEKALLAVSGGVDSTALLHILVTLKAEGTLSAEFLCAHINHQLRADEAQKDSDFVVEQCRKLDTPVVARRINVERHAKRKKLSIETAARQLRISALLEIAAGNNCTCIATAHQKNDNAETVLHRLSRGTGLRGLCGIWPEKKFTSGIRFIRPMLCVTRDEIVRYLNVRDLKWRIDRTNENITYRRNYIRHRLIPALRKNCDTNLVEQLSHLSSACRGFYRLICRRADAIWPDIASVDEHEVILHSQEFGKHLPEVKIEVIRRVLSHLDVGEQDFTQQHYENLMTLQDSAKLQLPGSVRVRRQGDKIVFSHVSENPPAVIEPVTLKVPDTTEFAGMRIEAEIFDYNPQTFKQFKAAKTNTVEWFDFDSLSLPLKVRFRKPGDRFRPLGLPAEKKIGKFLTDAGMPESIRRKAFVVADGEKIIWLCPVRISEKAKVTERTKKILQLKLRC